MKKIISFLKNHIVIILITLIYTIVSFINLGSITNPQTFWTVDNSNEFVDYQIDGGENSLSKIRFYIGRQSGSYSVFVSGNDNAYKFLCKIGEGFEFSWNDIEVQSENITNIRIISEQNQTSLGEICCYDENGKKLNLISSDENSKLLIDEPQTVPEEISYMNSTYFDEIYHARAAYEIVNKLVIYETVHPQLGKIIMSLPIHILGMTPFAYRLMGNLVGIGMLIIIYCIANTIFKKKIYGNLAAILMASDGMHFAQTRIATVDSYLVFFILLSFLFMYKYLELSTSDSLKKKFKYLALSGIFIGCAIATKWTGLFAGLGLAILFFAKLYRDVVIEKIDFTKEKLEIKFRKKKWLVEYNKIILFCIGAFVLVPIIIYILSSIPYFISGQIYDFSSFVSMLTGMFGYHSGLEDTHPFQSDWNTWPIMSKPVWYYMKDYGSEGYSTISGMGNPILWWFGAFTMIYTLFRTVFKIDRKSWYIIVPILSIFLPYSLIKRCMFLYHYFPVVPFMILSVVNFVQVITEKIKKNYVVILVSTIILCTFIYFFPVYSGMKVSKEYIDSTKWVSTWYY